MAGLISDSNVACVNHHKLCHPVLRTLFDKSSILVDTPEHNLVSFE